MEESSGEIGIRHLQGVVETPECSAERVTDSRETTTRSCVGLEHHEWLVLRLCVRRGIEVWRNDVPPRTVVKELRERFLRVVQGTNTKLGGTIVRGVAVIF